ncbi:NfeD family protein [Pseudomonas sp. MWU13-2100]|uniref:NfeD family protein n=1 Tax=Pseudomonas sp. MWU13-2100 TaxID=2935075 RepID=UPI00200F5E68|nr:NfeD family protein [Pseudomonas sp. MWU13-2100]
MSSRCWWAWLLLGWLIVWPVGPQLAEGADSVVTLLVLPIDDSGSGLILLGIALIVVEALLPSFGVIGFSGLVAVVAGTLILFDPQLFDDNTAQPLKLTLMLIGLLLLVGLIVAALKARQRQVVSGDAGLEGSLTPVTALKADDAYAGWVQLQGENWQVLSPTPLHTGQQVRVIARKGLLLEVKAVDDPPRRGD